MSGYPYVPRRPALTPRVSQPYCGRYCTSAWHNAGSPAGFAAVWRLAVPDPLTGRTFGNFGFFAGLLARSAG